ncbi:site-2 protease family protein, partial [Candidatus Daviesbacteria bacterium]|nr:site-2 protease family protein [Candidatus Daviesbacteria bacterium]
MAFTIIIFVLTLLILVLGHEFGHFLVSKKFKIKVLEFGFGIPPRIWGKKIGETLISINWLPIGGFVRLLGEDSVDKEVLANKYSFAAHPVGQRIWVVIAGVVMNLLLAWILFWIVVISSGFKEDLPLIKPHQFLGVNQKSEMSVLIGRVDATSPADQAGIKSGDRIVAVDDQLVVDSKQVVDLTKAKSGQKLSLTLLDRSNQKRIVEVTPRVNPPLGEGALGIELGTIGFFRLSYDTPLQKTFAGFTHSLNVVLYSGDILGSLIASSWQSRSAGPISTAVSGPVGITNITSAILQTQNPLIPYLDFIGTLSLNLAIFNILPIPALDGGRLFFLL